VTERPIDFNDEMVSALRKGRKSQTRRLVDPQPWPITKESFMMIGATQGDWGWSTGSPSSTIVSCKATGPTDYAKDYSPYGQIGDHLWVRESFSRRMDCEDGTDKALHYLHYKNGYNGSLDMEWHSYEKWQPAKKMPRWASRILLEITDIRLQRLQDISEEDAIAEGAGTAMFEVLVPGRAGPLRSPMCYKAGFACLWDKIYRKKDLGWYVNPWVWIYSFKVL
jgi:hypothetical protein